MRSNPTSGRDHQHDFGDAAACAPLKSSLSLLSLWPNSIADPFGRRRRRRRDKEPAFNVRVVFEPKPVWDSYETYVELCV